MKKTIKKTTAKAAFGLSPLSDRIVVREMKADDAKKTQSGIYLPETMKEDRGAKRGIVVAIGPGRFEDGKLIPMQVKVNDHVLFQWGEQITYQGEEYSIVRESEISAIIK